MSLGKGAGMDGAIRTDAASDQDTHCGRDPAGIRLSGISLPAGPMLATGEEPEQIPDTLRSKTRRTHGQSLKVIVADVNRTLRGWFGYFKHSNQTTFREVDG